MNLRTSTIERAVKSCSSFEAKRNVKNAYQMLHWVEDVLKSNRASLSLQSRSEIIRASAGDLPGRIQSEGLQMESHLMHLRQWVNEEITFAVVAADARHGYKAVNAIEKEAHPVSEAHKLIINRAKADLDSDQAKKEKAASSAQSTYNSSRGVRGRGARGVSRGRGSFNRFNNNNNYNSPNNAPPRGNNYNNNNNNNYNNNRPPIHCMICGRNGHLANNCYSKNKNDSKGSASGNSGGTSG